MKKEAKGKTASESCHPVRGTHTGFLHLATLFELLGDLFLQSQFQSGWKNEPVRWESCAEGS